MERVGKDSEPSRQGNLWREERNAANPWRVGHEDEIKNLHDNINGLVMRRNEVLPRRSSISQDIDHFQNNLRKARRAMKRRLRQLERNWWAEIVDECTAVAERGDMGTMYKILRNLETRDSKPKTDDNSRRI